MICCICCLFARKHYGILDIMIWYNLFCICSEMNLRVKMTDSAVIMIMLDTAMGICSLDKSFQPDVHLAYWVQWPNAAKTLVNTNNMICSASALRWIWEEWVKMTDSVVIMIMLDTTMVTMPPAHLINLSSHPPHHSSNPTFVRNKNSLFIYAKLWNCGIVDALNKF